jgi:excisionase family DNA binding protein
MKAKGDSKPTRWLKPEEAASYLGLAISTIRNLTSARCIPFVRRGRITRYRQDELDRWLAQDVCAGRKTFADQQRSVVDAASATYSCRRRRSPDGDYDDNDSSVKVERTDGGLPDAILATGHHLRRLSPRDRSTMKRRIADAKSYARFRAANAARAERQSLAVLKSTTRDDAIDRAVRAAGRAAKKRLQMRQAESEVD